MKLLDRPRVALAVNLLIAALGFWARCTNWRSVFRADHVELIPADSHYYVRFALLQLHHLPHFVRFDPFVNFPTGAHIYWPPVHTYLVAAAVALAGDPERGGAWLAPAVSLAWMIGLAFALRRRGAVGSVVLLLLALVPAAFGVGALGTADHHEHQPFLVALAVLALSRAGEGKRGVAAATGLLLGGARLLTTSGFLLTPGAAVTLWAMARLDPSLDRGALRRSALWMGGVAAIVLTLAVLVAGEPGALEYERLCWFHPLLVLASFGAVLAALDTGARRWGWVALAAAAVAGMAPQVFRAAGHLGHTDPLLAAVEESTPLAGAPRWAAHLFGATLFGLPLAFLGAWRMPRAALARFAGAWCFGAPLLLAAAFQERFAPDFSGAVAWMIPLGLPWALPERFSLARTALGAGMAAGALSLGTALAVLPLEPPDGFSQSRSTLMWMRTALPPASPDPFGAAPPAYGVAAEQNLGHPIVLWGQRPAVGSTFSQTAEHVAGNALDTRLLSAASDEDAFSQARAAKVRYVVATPARWLVGTEDLDRNVALLPRLSDTAGVDEKDASRTLAHFRLIHESPEWRGPKNPASYTRLFEVVEGAVLTGTCAPGAEVRAELPLTSNAGHPLRYARSTHADPTGAFHLRVAYATGAAGDVHAAAGDAYAVRCGGQLGHAHVGDDAVETGGATPVAWEDPLER